LAAHKLHAEKNSDFESQTMFTPESIIRYLPKSVFQTLEKKPGGVLNNLHKALVELTKFSNPSVLEEIEVEGGAENAKFQITTRRLLDYLQNRIIHEVSELSYCGLDLSLVSLKSQLICFLLFHYRSFSIARARWRRGYVPF
jgi:hypothetical protein